VLLPVVVNPGVGYAGVSGNIVVVDVVVVSEDITKIKNDFKLCCGYNQILTS
jgi:hypothetical protein